MISLRDYQNDAIKATLDARGEGITRPLVCLPTGTGKTIVFAEIARLLKAKTLILAHREELIRQAADKVSMVWPEATIGIVKAEQNDYRDKDVVCGSVQTLCRENRLKQVSAEGFEFLVIDEAHHSCASTYRDIIEQLGFIQDDPKRLLFGCTATAYRGDKQGLGHIYQKIVYEVSILTMIRAGYLADIRGFRVDTGEDISSVGVSRGDFIESQLAEAINTHRRNRFVVDSYLEHAPGRKAIAFCASIDHAKDLADAFTTDGIVAKALSCNTPEEERREALAAFRRGDIHILTNCALFTEGFDEPSIECILMCRPTKSSLLYTQCIGRGTRKHPGKADCVVIDFCDNRHDVCRLPQLLGFDKGKLADGESVREEIEAQEEYERSFVQVDGLFGPKKLAVKEYDLLGKSVFRWFHDGNKWRLPVSPGVYAILTPDDGKFKAVLFSKEEGRTLLHHTPLDLGYGQGICEDYARKHGMAFSRKDASWRGDPATDKQIAIMTKYGMNPVGMTKGQISDVLEEFFARKDARKNRYQSNRKESVQWR